MPVPDGVVWEVVVVVLSLCFVVVIAVVVVVVASVPLGIVVVLYDKWAGSMIGACDGSGVVCPGGGVA